jgi:threonine/homoserine/homoserine lactone efflux protein
MASADLSRVLQKQAKGSAGWAEKLFAVVLLGTMIAALGIRNILPADALTPVITTLLFALAAAAAGFALLWRRKQRRTMWLDIAGVLTFVGVAISILIEPDQLIRLFTHSDQPD